MRFKLPAIALGICLVLVVNLVRLVGLFWVGVYYPDAFAVAHDYVGQSMVVLSAAGYWLLWMRRTEWAL